LHWKGTYTSPFSITAAAAPSNYDRPNRLKGRDEGIRWNELLEKFRAVQDKARRAQRAGMEYGDGFGWADARSTEFDSKTFKDLTRLAGPPAAAKDATATGVATQAQAQIPKPKSGGLGGKFGRLGGAVSGSRPKK
jgi:vacuole morphology and inheritance protein 14